MQSRSRIFAEGIPAEKLVPWHLSRLVAELHPGKAIIDGVNYNFDIDALIEGKQCAGSRVDDAHHHLTTAWSRDFGVYTHAPCAIWAVRWDGNDFIVVHATWTEGYRAVRTSVVVADSLEIGHAFVAAGSAWCNQPQEAVLCFNNGCWSEDSDMYKQVQAANFDDLVLAGDLKRQIQEDFSTFLAAKDEYARYGIPHKRGVLFTGPPGNGKTHCVRATLKFLNVPALYVMSIKERGSPDEANIALVFDRARELTPCVLVFEDLDSMINDDNRSYFLNQLDGIGSVSGLLTIATTNHPERLDPAIVERPSRFDRKYHFALPGAGERRSYFDLWNKRWDADMRIDSASTDELVSGTSGFSFAYLKELHVSAMMRWVSERKPGAMATHLRQQVSALRSQMTTHVAPATSDNDQ